ncbi:MAG: ABC transporter substrate-binding protein [Flavipsychrobacter sp.]
MVIQIAGCKSAAEDKRNNVFLLNLSSGTLESMDPAFAKDLYMMWTANMVYNTLVETDENLHLKPSLAKSWEVSEDGLTHTFHLRDDVYFQDNEAFENGEGRKMVAADVAYSFGRIIDPKVASYGAWIFNDRVAKEKPFVAVDDTTFQIRLVQPFKPLVEILSMKYCSIVPREVVEQWGKDFRAHACGTGPFIVSDWEEGSMLLLQKNANYWERDEQGNQLPYIDAIKTTFVDSKATEFFLFLQGKLDFVNGIDGSFKDLVLTKKGALKEEFVAKVDLTKRPYLNTEYIGFLTDTTSEVMKGATTNNVLVRQAINYAIDREKIVTYFRNGAVTPAYSGFIPKGMPGYDTTHSYGYSYQPQKSLELLAAAGYPNGNGLKPITILTPDNYADIVNFIANQLQEVGIPVQVEILQANLLRQQMSRSKAPMFRAQWIADYPDAETYLVFFKGDIPAPPNYTRFKNDTYDKWYNEAMNAPDSLRFALYRSMDSLAIRNAPLIPLFYDQMLHFTSKRVSGMQSTPMNVIDLKRVRLN